jgi:hypothetical protein
MPSGNWHPLADFFEKLLSTAARDTLVGGPGADVREMSGRPAISVRAKRGRADAEDDAGREARQEEGTT